METKFCLGPWAKTVTLTNMRFYEHIYMDDMKIVSNFGDTGSHRTKNKYIIVDFEVSINTLCQKKDEISSG